MERKAAFQIGVSLALLLLAELLYRTFPVAGFDHPFTPNHNFGTWLDLQYGGADLRGHWVAFNAVPTAAHTIWGVLAGKLLMEDRPAREKVGILLGAAVLCLAAGYALQPVTPFIKRIATSSFVIVSGGWALLALALSHLVVDLWKPGRWALVFTVVGLNPLFIYLFAHVGGGAFLRKIVLPFSDALLGWTGGPVSALLRDGIVWFLLWYLTYWLYRRKIFLKI